MIEYFKQVRAEMKHVAWPSRRQIVAFTAVVVVVSIGTSLYLGLADYLFQLGIQHVIGQ